MKKEPVFGQRFNFREEQYFDMQLISLAFCLFSLVPIVSRQALLVPHNSLLSTLSPLHQTIASRAKNSLSRTQNNRTWLMRALRYITRALSPLCSIFSSTIHIIIPAQSYSSNLSPINFYTPTTHLSSNSRLQDGTWKE